MPLSVLTALGSRKINPSVDRIATQAFARHLVAILSPINVEAIYASPAQRCPETASIIADAIRATGGIAPRPTVSRDLREVTFNLSRLVANPDISPRPPRSITAVNRVVLHGMALGRHAEALAITYRRAGRVLQHLIKHHSSGIVICVTHDFFMRVLQIYVQRQAKPLLALREQQLQRTWRNTYLSGFAVDAATFNLRRL
jgi:broad specificity phosphatase PhoE